MKSVACIWRAWAWIRWVGGWCDRRAQIEDIWAARHALSATSWGLSQPLVVSKPPARYHHQTKQGFQKTAQWFSMWLCIYVIWEREKKSKLMKGESPWEIPKFASLVYPCYIMWKLFEGKGRCAVFILFKINNMFHVRLWFVLLPKQLLSVSFCGWFTVALTFATKQLYIISTVRKFPIPSIPIKET